MVKKWILKKTNLGFKLSTLDYPSLKVYENISLYFYLILRPISEVRTHKQSSRQFISLYFYLILGPISEVRTHKQSSRQFFSKTLLYEKENNMWVRT